MDISDRALLVSLTIREWTGRKKDRETTQEVCDAKRASSTAIHVSKNLLGDSVKPVSSAGNLVRATLNRHSLPWFDEGARILKGTAFNALSNALISPMAGFSKAVDEFMDYYSGASESFRQRLGSAFDEADYPPPHVVRARFGISVTYLPIPSQADFRAHLSDDEMALVRASAEATVRDTVHDAMADVVRRLQKPIAHMAERLAMMSEDADGKRVHAFRDSLVRNVREIADLAPQLNVTDDPRIAALCDEIQFFLTDHEPEELRNSKGLRDQVSQQASAIAAKADGILAQMAGAFG